MGGLTIDGWQLTIDGFQRDDYSTDWYTERGRLLYIRLHCIRRTGHLRSFSITVKGGRETFDSNPNPFDSTLDV